MKKIIKIIIGIVVFLIIACFVATGVLLYNLYDDTNNTPTDIATNNYSTEELINRELTYSFDDSSDIYFELDEKDLNEILYSLSKKFNHMYFKGLGAYVKFEADGSITLFRNKVNRNGTKGIILHYKSAHQGCGSFEPVVLRAVCFPGILF